VIPWFYVSRARIAVFLIELHETETRFLVLTEENTLRACAKRKQRTPGNKQDKTTGIYRKLHRMEFNNSSQNIIRIT
jgi:hypothetical protein